MHLNKNAIQYIPVNHGRVLRMVKSQEDGNVYRETSQLGCDVTNLVTMETSV